MAKPISQSFYINETTGIEGVVLTRVDLYFQSISSTAGVTLEIRTMENGVPTSYRLPDAQKRLLVTDKHPNNAPIIRASNDASVPTIFQFETPIPLQSQTSYAMVIIPDNGDPNYKIWAAELSKTDVLTKTPIRNNNDTGDLFLSSNDRTFTPIITEDIKFKMYTANFTETSGTAVYEIPNFENIVYYSQTKPFIKDELIFMSETNYNLARLDISSNTAAFTVGEEIFQDDGVANVAVGKVYGANSTVIKIANSTGLWSSSYEVMGVNSTANAVVTSVSQNVISYSNSTITVPFTDVFYETQMIYLGTEDRYTMDVYKVESKTDTTVKVAANVAFSDTNAMIGKIRGDGGLLSGFCDGIIEEDNQRLRNLLVLKSSTANSTVNFANSTGCFIIGLRSKSSAYCYDTVNLIYNAVAPTYSTIESKSTSLNFSFSGVSKTLAYDGSYTQLINGTETELRDKTRRLMSRSNEHVSKSGNNTFRIQADLGTSSSKFSPIISDYNRYVTFLRNSIIPASSLSGYNLELSNFNNYANIEYLTISQNNSSYTVNGTVDFANSSYMVVESNSNLSFAVGNTIYVTTNSSINAVVESSKKFGEKYNTEVNTNSSRYISKTVILAENQDAEDLKCYISAYRPAKTNLFVYSKIVNNQDPESIRDKYWSRMIETPESSRLLSSGSDINDFVELVYNFPEASEIFADGVSCNTTSANITVSTSVDVNDFDYVYLHDVTNNKFIVRQVTSVANNTTIVVDNLPSFASSNCRFGTIPGLEDATGAFVLPDNNYIVRYVSNSDVVYDGFKTFNIKIVPVSDDQYLVPRADDMRCLALQV